MFIFSRCLDRENQMDRWKQGPHQGSYRPFFVTLRVHFPVGARLFLPSLAPALHKDAEESSELRLGSQAHSSFVKQQEWRGSRKANRHPRVGRVRAPRSWLPELWPALPLFLKTMKCYSLLRPVVNCLSNASFPSPWTPRPPAGRVK